MNGDCKFVTEWEGRSTQMRWRPHKLKRRVRSTLAAETMASGEAAEAGDLLRARIAEVHHEPDLKNNDERLHKVPMVLVTDCRSLHDLLKKRGAAPEEQAGRLSDQGWCEGLRLLAMCVAARLLALGRASKHRVGLE